MTSWLNKLGGEQPQDSGQNGTTGRLDGTAGQPDGTTGAPAAAPIDGRVLARDERIPATDDAAGPGDAGRELAGAEAAGQDPADAGAAEAGAMQPAGPAGPDDARPPAVQADEAEPDWVLADGAGPLAAEADAAGSDSVLADGARSGSVLADAVEPGAAGADGTRLDAAADGSAPDAAETGDTGADPAWQHIQALFVDDPRASTTQADGLVTERIEEFVTTVDGIIASVKEKQRTLLAGWPDADTEQLRQALHEYRALWQRLERVSFGS